MYKKSKQISLDMNCFVAVFIINNSPSHLKRRPLSRSSIQPYSIWCYYMSNKNHSMMQNFTEMNRNISTDFRTKTKLIQLVTFNIWIR